MKEFQQIYHQMNAGLDGVALGSPLGLALANIFVGFSRGVYFGYMDDIFGIFSSKLYGDHFHENLTLLHLALNFKKEKTTP